MAAIAVCLHLQNERPLTGAAPIRRLFRRRLDRQHVHSVDLGAGDAEAVAAPVELGRRRGALDGGAHAVAVVLNDVDHRQLPQLGHVEGFVDLALVDGAVAAIGVTDATVVLVLVGEGETGAERDLGADDAVAAEEVLFAAEHVHGAALALGIAAPAAGQFRHHPFRIHVAGEHMAVIAIRGNHRVVAAGRRHHADDDRFLADIQVAEAADQAHAIELPRLFLETADQQHLAVVMEKVVGARGLAFFAGAFSGRSFPRRFSRGGFFGSALPALGRLLGGGFR